MSIEDEIIAKGLTAPRITPADIEASIVREDYFTAANGVAGANGTVPSDADNLRLLTFCVLSLKNGFTVVGESACVSPENFIAEIGRKVARDNAVNKVWLLLGFSLAERLHLAKPGNYADRLSVEIEQLQDRIAKLAKFLKERGDEAPQGDLLRTQLAFMDEYLGVLLERKALL